MDLIILSLTLLFSVAVAFAAGHAFLDLVFFFLLKNTVRPAATPRNASADLGTGTFSVETGLTGS